MPLGGVDLHREDEPTVGRRVRPWTPGRLRHSVVGEPAFGAVGVKREEVMAASDDSRSSRGSRSDPVGRSTIRPAVRRANGVPLIDRRLVDGHDDIPARCDPTRDDVAGRIEGEPGVSRERVLATRRTRRDRSVGNTTALSVDPDELRRRVKAVLESEMRLAAEVVRAVGPSRGEVGTLGRSGHRERDAAGGIDVDQHRALRGLPAVFKDGRGHPSSVDRLVADEVIRHGGAAVESGQEHHDCGDGRCDSNRRSRGHPTTVYQPPSNGVAGGGDDPRERLETRVAGR